MWRKTDKHKRLYVSTLKTLSQKDFDPLSWSIVLYFNTPSVSDFEQGTVKPQPMIPNQVELVPDVAPTPEEKIYGDPDEPLPGLRSISIDDADMEAISPIVPDLDSRIERNRSRSRDDDSQVQRRARSMDDHLFNRS